AIVSDAIPLLTMVGGVIVVSRLGQTTRDAVRHLRSHLDHLEAPVLGVVINSVDSGAGYYGSGYGYGYGRPPGGGPNGASAKQPGRPPMPSAERPPGPGAGDYDGERIAPGGGAPARDPRRARSAPPLDY
ncbi:MAG TPA: hypothetical protein VGV57_12475, partial [Thermoleophilaceae bacterium]|nr:hypothetical protein [Thermoleophilaceae bacterium]